MNSIVPTPPPRSDKPIRIRVSDAPEVRLQQMDGFFRRNPGYVKTNGVMDAARAVAERAPRVRGAMTLLEPTELGYGQLIHDQMEWQIRTGRQPNDKFWMRMNKQMVEDPLIAEAHLRNGRVADLKTPAQKAWATFIKASDRVRGALGIEPDHTYLVSEKSGERLPLAISDAWRGASLLDRIKIQVMYKPAARKALWRAHQASLDTGRALSKKEARREEQRMPNEAEFLSGFANSIKGYAAINAPATGHTARLAQRHLLPIDHPVKVEELTPLRRMFYKLVTKLDPHYEREIKHVEKPGKSHKPHKSHTSKQA